MQTCVYDTFESDYFKFIGIQMSIANQFIYGIFMPKGNRYWTQMRCVQLLENGLWILPCPPQKKQKKTKKRTHFSNLALSALPIKTHLRLFYQLCIWKLLIKWIIMIPTISLSLTQANNLTLYVEKNNLYYTSDSTTISWKIWLHVHVVWEV